MDGRTKQLIARVTPNEHARIMQVATEGGTTASDLIRDFIANLATLAEKTERRQSREEGYRRLAASPETEDDFTYPAK